MPRNFAIMKYKVALLYFAFTFIILPSFIPTQAKPKPLAELPFEMHKNLIILKLNHSALEMQRFNVD